MNSELLTDEQAQEPKVECELEPSDNGSSKDASLMPGWEQCPLCPGHLDESYSFRWNHLLDAKVCHGCSYDLDDFFFRNSERPLVSDGYSYEDSQMGLLEMLTGLNFQQLKFKHLVNKIFELNDYTPDYVDGIDFLAMPECELRILNKRLDDEFLDIIEANKKTTRDKDSKFDNLAFNSLSKVIKENPA